MNRSQWEMQAIARREGWRDLSCELQRRARERRTAKLDRDWQGEEQRFANRRDDDGRSRN